MSEGGIYLVRNSLNGKVYVGSTKDFRGRFCNHKSALRLGKHPNPRLQAAWNKYGENCFVFEVAEVVTDLEKILEREQAWIDQLNACQVGYNLCPTAGSSLGKPNPLKGQPRPEDVRERIRASSIGKKMSEESKQKMRLAKKGRSLSPEHIANRTAAQRGGTKSPQWKQKVQAALGQRFQVTDPNGNTFEVHNLTQFCREQGLSQANMTAVSKGRLRHHKGWKCQKVLV